MTTKYKITIIYDSRSQSPGDAELVLNKFLDSLYELDRYILEVNCELCKSSKSDDPGNLVNLTISNSDIIILHKLLVNRWSTLYQRTSPSRSSLKEMQRISIIDSLLKIEMHSRMIEFEDIIPALSTWSNTE
jgi:hypothetical protein|tara:strand:- start:2599 stop:2994 length:396 start_codon:yes stop_codon:yes gene_type:complete